MGKTTKKPAWDGLGVRLRKIEARRSCFGGLVVRKYEVVRDGVVLGRVSKSNVEAVMRHGWTMSQFGRVAKGYFVWECFLPPNIYAIEKSRSLSVQKLVSMADGDRGESLTQQKKAPGEFTAMVDGLGK